MQKIIFMVIAIIVHYIAIGNGHCPLESENPQRCGNGNTRTVAPDFLPDISGFSQNGTGLSARSPRLDRLPYLWEALQ